MPDTQISVPSRVTWPSANVNFPGSPPQRSKPSESRVESGLGFITSHIESVGCRRPPWGDTALTPRIPPQWTLCSSPRPYALGALKGLVTLPSGPLTLQKPEPRTSLQGEMGPGLHRMEMAGLGSRPLALKLHLFVPHPTDAWSPDPRNQGSPSNAVQMRFCPPSAFGQGGHAPGPAASSLPPEGDPWHRRWAPGSCGSPPKTGLFPVQLKLSPALPCPGNSEAEREEEEGTFAPIVCPPDGHSSCLSSAFIPLTQATTFLIHSFVCSLVHSFSTSWGPEGASDRILATKELSEGGQDRGGENHRNTSSTCLPALGCLAWDGSATGQEKSELCQGGCQPAPHKRAR